MDCVSTTLVNPSKPQEKSISALQEQLISSKEENKVLKEYQSNTLAKDKQLNKFDSLFHSQLLQEWISVA